MISNHYNLKSIMDNKQTTLTMNTNDHLSYRSDGH